MLRLTAGMSYVLALGLALGAADTAAQAPAAKVTPASTVAPAPAKPKAHSRKKPATPVVEEQPPAPPPTPEQLPPTPPQVTYRDGQLSISANNATLSQVLRSVQAKTGASVEMPGGASAERVVAQLGPGQPREVLNALLNGTKFDYIILGVAGNPGAVQKVILTTQTASSSAVNTAQNNRPVQPVQAPEDEPQEEIAPPEPEVIPEPNATPTPQPSFRRPPMPPRMGEMNQQPQPDGSDNSQQNVKSPEELLQELQQMQQQQQQMQQQLNPANRPPQ